MITKAVQDATKVYMIRPPNELCFTTVTRKRKKPKATAGTSGTAVTPGQIMADPESHYVQLTNNILQSVELDTIFLKKEVVQKILKLTFGFGSLDIKVILAQNVID